MLPSVEVDAPSLETFKVRLDQALCVAVAYIDLQAVGAEITTVPKYPLP